jgi:hypothetical protein
MSKITQQQIESAIETLEAVLVDMKQIKVPSPETKIENHFFLLPRIINKKFYWLVTRKVKKLYTYWITQMVESSDDVIVYRAKLLEVVKD